MFKLHRALMTLLSVGFVLFLGLSGARAQAVYGTDYVTFEGTLIVLDNPTTSACQAHNVNYGSSYFTSYRFTANPSVISDALAIFPSGHAAARFVSTQSPNFSLAGSSTTTGSYINSYANSNSSAVIGSSNLTILSGNNQPVSLATGNIKILGSINNFDGTTDCNVASVHGALVVRPF